MKMTPEELMYFIVGYLAKTDDKEGLNGAERVTLFNIVSDTIKHNETTPEIRVGYHETLLAPYGLKCTCMDVTNIECPVHPKFTFTYSGPKCTCGMDDINDLHTIFNTIGCPKHG